MKTLNPHFAARLKRTRSTARSRVVTIGNATLGDETPKQSLDSRSLPKRQSS